MKVHEALAAAVLAEDLGPVHALMGDGNMAFLSAFHAVGGRIVTTAHEASAVSMADGRARATGEVAIASLTHGPGLTNAMTALVEAVRARSPIVVLTADTETPQHRQWIDIPALVAASGAGVHRLGPADDVTALLRDAVGAARSQGRPQVVDIPVALVFAADHPRPAESAPFLPPSGPDLGVGSTPDPESVELAAGAALSARRPLVLAGRGACAPAAREALVRLATALGAPLATTLRAKDLFAGREDDLGICGTLSTPRSASLLDKADCVLSFGASLSEHTLAGLGSPRIHSFTLGQLPAGSDGADVVAAAGDAAAAASAVTALVHSVQESAPAPWWMGMPSTAPSADLAELDRGMQLLDRHLPTERVVVTDVGRFAVSPWAHLHVPRPQQFLPVSSFAAVGLGLGTAIGAALAHPDSRTVLVVGDGGLMMGSVELSTVARLRVPMLVVVVNDAMYGAEFDKLKGFGLDPELSRCQWPDLAGMARAAGMQATTVTSFEELDQTLAEVADGRTPHLVDWQVGAR